MVKRNNKRSTKRNTRRNNKRHGRKPGSAQKKFELPKPEKKVIQQLSNILETKKFQGLDYISALDTWQENPIEAGDMPLNAAGLSFMPDSFYRMQFQTAMNRATGSESSLTDNCIEGTSVFSKYLQCKVQIDYPDGSQSPQECPRPLEIIWGWVNPLNFTEFTSPKIDEVTPLEIRNHTLNSIAEEFNSMTDPMEFHDKHKRRYNIIGRKKIIPKLHNQVPTRSLNPGLQGQASAKIHTNINFKMDKKVNYTASEAKGDTDTPHFAYPNEAYLPWVFLYNPDFAMYDVSGVSPIKWKFNDCHWFNDA
ncbi:MAG: hypothetical protein [Circular genetic element sp.]|nr:MAG: hypothetical protein [Circular genetic element sp.]